MRAAGTSGVGGGVYTEDKKRIKRREMICLQYFHNIFITNPKWQVLLIVIVGAKK